MIRLVHSVRDHAARPGLDRTRIASLFGAEHAGALAAQAEREADGLRSAIAQALAHTEERPDKGRLSDMRGMLQRLREEADGVSRLVGRLTAAADPRAGERRVVHLEDVLDRALEQLPAMTTIVRTGQSDLPPVAGHARHLTHMILALLGGDAAPGAVSVETSAREGVIRGEWIVRLRLVDRRAGARPDEADMATAARIAREHGGLVSTERVEDGCAFTVDLPAL
jgi:nitrogen-specific signal transduction histidine kinase